MAHGGKLGARVGWLGAAIVPPGVVLAARWNLVSAHALLSGTLVVAYEGIFAVGAYATNIAGELGRRWQGEIVDRLDRVIRRRISPFQRMYRDFLMTSLRTVDVKALTTVGHHTPELDEVFVDVSLDRRAPHRVPAELLAGEPAPEPAAERRSIWEFVDRAEPAVLAVVGGPGSGKTTLLRHIARRTCQAHRGRRRRVPILLYLRDHAATINDSPNRTLPEILRGTLDRFAAEEPPGWFDQQLDGGDCLVLLDGLDEVGQQDRRTGVAEWIERQIRMYPKNDFVITSRPRGYDTSRIGDATVLWVRPFSRDQVERFVQGWYLAVERDHAGSDGADVRSRARTAADELLDRLLSTPALDELTVNPLLLTMITNVHRERGELPGSRVELYREICEVILWRRQDAKKIRPAFGGNLKEPALRALAYTMMRREVRDLPHSEVVAVLRPYLPGVPPAGPGVEDLIADVTSNGLLVERERNLVAFAHHSFQEYLAAAHIEDEELGDVLLGTVDKDWWHLTTLLYAARNDAGPLVRACLASLSVNALALALDCADQAEDVDVELRERLNGLLGSAFDPGTGSERRDLLARAVVTRHLRERVRAGEGGQVVARPVTVGLYRLFLQYVPDQHLDGKGLDGSTDDEPVVGVRADGALALVRWVNDLLGGTRAYRLPTSAEVNDPAVHRTLATRLPDPAPHSVWLEPDHPGAHPRLWAPTPHDPHAVDTATIGRQLADDIALGTAQTLARLRLVRAVALFCGRACARDLAPAVAEVRDAARELVRDLTGVRDVSTSSGRTKHLDSARRRMRDIDRHLVRIGELAGDLGGALGGVRDLDPVRDIALDLSHSTVLSRHLDGLRELVEVTDDHTQVGAQGVRRARSLLLDLDRYHDRSQALATHQGLDGALATAFADAVTLLDASIVDRDAGARLQSSEFLAVLRRQFVSRTVDARTARYSVPPHVLAGTVREACAALAALVTSEGSPLPPWVADLAASFEQLALPMATGAEPPTADRAAAIRVAGLSLAAEVDAFFTGRRIAQMFREVVAGATLVQLRHNGQVPITETVFLALR